MAKASNEKLEGLHEILAQVLTSKIQSGDFDASTLNVARQFLKDNGVATTSAENLRALADGVGGIKLPFPQDAANEDSPTFMKRA